MISLTWTSERSDSGDGTRGKIKGEPDALPCGNDCEPSEGVARKRAFVACCPDGLDQAGLFVVTNGRHAHTRASSEVAARHKLTGQYATWSKLRAQPS